MRAFTRSIVTFLAIVICLAACTSAGLARTIYVKPDGNDVNNGLSWSTAKRTVQAGIYAAVFGDEVWVVQGTYADGIYLKSGVSVYGGFTGNETLRTQRDFNAHVTILDGSWSGSVVTASSYLDPDATAIDGFTIQHGSYANGGGISLSLRASPKIENNRIVDNEATQGGGIFCTADAVPLIDNNVISDNVAGTGGAICCTDTSTAEAVININHNKLTGNVSGNGAGIYCLNYPALIEYNTISSNSGMGIVCDTSSSTINANKIIGNAGSGIYTTNSDMSIFNCVVAGNIDPLVGGIECVSSSTNSVQIVNNTIIGNYGWQSSPIGGVLGSNCTMIFSNNIVAFNTPSGVKRLGTSSWSEKNNCVYSNGTNYVGIPSVSADIGGDPLLADCKYGNFHIQPTSPCRNSGYNIYASSIAYDIDGQVRKQNSTVDIGADESDNTSWAAGPYGIIRVKPTGNNSNDGSSWASAKSTVQAAVDAASDFSVGVATGLGGDVWVMGGTYNGQLILRPQVSVYGGFSGSETSRSQRNPATNATILNGQGAGSTVVGQSGNITSTLDGFTIQNGNSPYGGGILLDFSSAEIANNTVTSNTASSAGGGIYCDPGFATIVRNKISANASASGGGIYANAPVTIRDNAIYANTASTVGGGVYLTSGALDALLENNTIANNSAAQNGGGIYFVTPSVTVANTIVAFNTGGGLYGQNTATSDLHSNCVAGNSPYDYSRVTAGSADVKTDPLMVNKTTGDFHLTPTSPCIDKGDDNYVSAGDTDLDGNARIKNTHVDIGCYEYYPAGSPPVNVSTTPNSGGIGVGIKTTFTSKYSDADGVDNLAWCYLLLNQTTGVSSNSVYALYNAVTNKLYLRNDAGTGWLGAFAPGASNVIENSQCKLYCANTTTSTSGNERTVNWKIEMKPTMAGKTLMEWMYVVDKDDFRSSWDKKGAIRVGQGPLNVSLSPNNGNFAPGVKSTFAAQYGDPDGYTDLAYCYLLLNTTYGHSENSVYLLYNAITNKLYLRNDGNSAWLGGYTPGSAYTMENSQCKIYCAETTTSGAGTNRTVNWKIEFKSAYSGRILQEWMSATDKISISSPWETKGSIVLSRAPSDVSLTPAGGTLTTGTKLTFAAKYSDPDGFANLYQCYLLLNTQVGTRANSIYLRYNRNQNQLSMLNDIGNIFVGGYAPGSSNVIENSQCKVYCAETTKTESGTDLTINWKIELKPAMAGKTLLEWMYVTDRTSLFDGWDKLGTATVQ